MVVSDDLKTPERESSSSSAGFQGNESGFLKTLLANTPDFVYLKDRERRYLKVSKPFEDLFGSGLGEIRGRRDEEIFPPDVAAEGRRDDRRVIEEGISLVNKVEGSDTPGGGSIWVLTTKIPWRDDDGNILGLFGISRDITDRIQAEEALLEETEFTRASLDALQDTFFVFDPGTGKAVRWNRNFREASGFSDDEIARLPAPDSYYSPRDLERARAFIEEVSERGFGVIELDLVCKDGRLIPTEYKVAILNNKDSEPQYIIAVGRDITERKRAAEALRVQSERLVRFMDSATDSFHLLDSELRIIEINKTALGRLRELGGETQDKKGVQGRLLVDVYPFLRGRKGEARLRDVLRTGKPVTYDDSAEHPVRGTVHMTVKLFKVGEDLGLIATDISDRKRAEDERLSLERQVQHTQKLESLGVLAGGIAHDFNNILVSILGHADLLKEVLLPGNLGGKHVEEILVGARRAADLANEMLAYSGKGQIELRKINLNEFVEEMTHLLQASTSKKARLRFDFASDLTPIECDITQVGQVVMNLIINASEAIGDATGVISVATGKTALEGDERPGFQAATGGQNGDFVYLEVTDTGCGMDEETKQKMFEPFFTTKFTGRGLGMAAVQGIVRSHGGAIEVHSEPGEGTRVRVLFPAVHGPSESIGSHSLHEARSDSWTGSGTALVVDDEESVRSLLKDMLEAVGFRVLTAADGHEAIGVFREHMDDIRVVILDLTMPNMDGEECHRALVGLRSDVRVIVSSGYSEQQISERFAGRGIRGFVQKPYRLATIKAKLRAVLQD